MIEVDDKRRKRAMIGPVNPTDAEQTVMSLRAMVVDLNEYVSITSLRSSLAYLTLAVWR
jgi:hypothetical protein